MTRSNRQLTQFVVDRIRYALSYGADKVNAHSVAGNTEVDLDFCNSCPRPAHLVVKLFGKEIARLFFSPIDTKKVAGLMISAGDFYDSKGRPSRTTRERLNGILDALGAAGFLPEGVRTFIHKDTSVCCVGRDEDCRELSSEQPRVIILANSKEINFS